MSKELIEAAKVGDLKRVTELTKIQADVTFSDEEGLTALHWAVKSNHIEVVNFLVNFSSVTLHQKDANGNTALIHAAINDRAAIMKLLLDKGAIVDEKDSNDNTALMLSASMGHVETAELLLKRGASVTATNRVGHTALKIAFFMSQSEIIRLFFNFGIYLPAASGARPLFRRSSLLIMAEDLINFASLVSSKYEKESLESRYQKELDDCLSFLGNGVNARRESDGNTALHLAIQNGHTFLVRALVRNGASLNLTNREDRMPVQIAKQVNNYFILAIHSVNEMISLSKRMELLSSKALKAEFDEHDAIIQNCLLSLEGEARHDICCKVGMIHNHLPQPDYIKAYRLLSQVKNGEYFKSAVRILYDLLFSGKVVLRRNDLTEEFIPLLGEEHEIKVDTEEYNIRLREMTRYKLILDPSDPTACHFGAQYVDPSLSIRGLPGFTGVNVTSTMNLLKALKEVMRFQRTIKEAKQALEISSLTLDSKHSKAQLESLKLNREQNLHLNAENVSVKVVEEKAHSEKRMVSNVFPFINPHQGRSSSLSGTFHNQNNPNVQFLTIFSPAGYLERTIYLGKDAHGNTALINAVIDDCRDTVKLLLDQGVPIDEKSKGGFTALTAAIAKERIEIAELLLKRGANITERRAGYPSLIDAIIRDRTAFVKLLLDSGASPDEKCNDGITALIHAVVQGNLEIVKLLLDSGAPIDGKDIRGITALMAAAQMGHVEIMIFLWGRRASLTERDNRGGTALMNAATTGQTAIVKWLLDAGVLIDEKGDNDFTALVYAAQGGHVETATLLLDRGANMAAKVVKDNTILMQTAAHGQTEVAKLLLDRKVFVDERGGNDLHPFLWSHH